MITIPGVAPNMIANNLTPAYPTHPGEVLKDEKMQARYNMFMTKRNSKFIVKLNNVRKMVAVF